MKKLAASLTIGLLTLGVFLPLAAQAQTATTTPATTQTAAPGAAKAAALERVKKARAVAVATQEAARAKYDQAAKNLDKCWWFCNVEKNALDIATTALNGAAAAVNLNDIALKEFTDPAFANRTDEQWGKVASASEKSAHIADGALATEAEGSCVSMTEFSVGTCIKDVISWIGYLLLLVLAFILKLVSLMLDTIINYSIKGMSTNIGKITTLTVAWQTLRDFANMAFIFFLLWIAIQTILGAGSSTAKKTLGQIVIAAILINFSLFITKAAIDFSNIVTLAFFDQITHGKSLSETFMTLLKIPGLFKSPVGAQAQIMEWGKGENGWSVLFGMLIGSSAIMFVAIFSFAALAFMFIIRYAILIMLMVLSPIAFAAMALPQLKSYAKQWKDALISQVMFPIIYMIIMLVTVTIIGGTVNNLVPNTDASFIDAFKKTATASGAAPADAVGIFISFALIIIFMNFALITAASTAAKAGGKAEEAFKYGLGKVSNLRKSTVAMAQRQVLNRGARAAGKLYTTGVGVTGKFVSKNLNSASLRDRANNVQGTGFIQNTKRSVLGKLSKGVGATEVAVKAVNSDWGADKIQTNANNSTGLKKFALRALGGAVGATSTITKGVTIKPLGAATKTAAIAVDRTISDNLEKAEKAKMEGTENLEEYEKYVQKRTAKIKSAEQEYEDKKKIEAGKNIDLAAVPATPADKEAALGVMKGLTEAIKDLTAKEIEVMDTETLSSEAVLANMSNSQFDGLLKSEVKSYSEQEKNDLKKKRSEGLKKWANNNVLGKLTDTQRTAIETAKAAGDPPPKFGTFEEAIQGKKPSEIAEMPVETIASLATNGMVDASVLQQVQDKGNVNATRREAIRKEVENNYINQQVDIEKAVDNAHTRMALSYINSHPGMSSTSPADIATAKSKYDASKIRITPDDVAALVTVPPTDPNYLGQTTKKAEELEKVRRSYDYLQSTKGINF